MTTWTKTSIEMSCPTCSGTCYLEQTERAPLRLRISAHGDIRDAVSVERPACLMAEQEVVLVRAAALDAIRGETTTAAAMMGYCEGRREAARDLDPRR